jgi:putative hemolysin
MTGLELTAWLLLGLVGLAGSWLCSGVETAVYSVNTVRLHIAAAAPSPRRRDRLLVAALQRKDALLASLLIGNNFFNYLGVLALTTVLAARGLSEPALLAVNVLVLTPILLLLAESLPKELFRLEANRLLARLVWFIRGLRILTTACGALPLLVAVARLVSRLAGAEGAAIEGLAGHKRHVAELLREGARGGALSPSQSTLVDRAIALSRARVVEVMRPWARVAAVGADWDRFRVAAFMVRHGRWAYPVVDRRGRVLGVIGHDEFFLRRGSPVADLLRPHVRLAPATPIHDALALLARAPGATGIVERAGQPLGLVRAGDLVAPLLADPPAATAHSSDLTKSPVASLG